MASSTGTPSGCGLRTTRRQTSSSARTCATPGRSILRSDGAVLNGSVGDPNENGFQESRFEGLRRIDSKEQLFTVADKAGRTVFVPKERGNSRQEPFGWCSLVCLHSQPHVFGCDRQPSETGSRNTC